MKNGGTAASVFVLVDSKRIFPCVKNVVGDTKIMIANVDLLKRLQGTHVRHLDNHAGQSRVEVEGALAKPTNRISKDDGFRKGLNPPYGLALGSSPL
jgi:hypothetical protein